MNRLNVMEKKYLFTTAIAAIGITAFALLPVIIKYHGSLYLFGDYMTQIIPFVKESRRLILSGNPAWSMNSFLGADFFGTYSYYTLGDPLFYPLVFLPESTVSVGLTIVFILKHMFAAVFSFLYLKKYVIKINYAFAGALMYTFSSFTFDSTYYYIFLNTIALFPLLLYYCDKCLENKSKTAFAVAVMLNAAVNYYLFVGTSVFFLIYLFFKTKYDDKQTWENAGRCVLFYSFGSICAAAVLVPSALTLLDTGKATGSFSEFFVRGLACIPQVIKTIKAVILPSEGIMGSANGFTYSNYNSNAAFLPLFGALFFIASLYIREKTWYFKLAKFLFFLSIIPFGNSVFSLFSNPNYTRWWYAFVLIEVVCSLIIIESIENNTGVYRVEIRKSMKYIMFFSIICMVVPFLTKLFFSGDNIVGKLKENLPPKAVSALDNSGFTQKINSSDIRYAVAFIILCLLSYFVLFVLVKKRYIYIPGILSVTVIIVCALSYCVYIANESDIMSMEPEKNTVWVSMNSDSDRIDYSYRVDYKNGFHNMSMIENKPAINTFNSFKSKSTCNFCRLAGIETDSFAKRKFDTKAIQTVLSVKQTVDKDLNIKECEYYTPFGYEYDYYLTYSSEDLKPSSDKKENNRKIQNMCSACYLDEDTARELSYLLEPFDKENYNWKEAVKEAGKTSCTNVHINQKSITAVSTGDKPRLLYFSVPHDRGWKAYINGKPTTIYTLNGGIMGIVAKSGKSEIKFVYETPGLKLGMAVSFFAFVCLIVYFFINKKKESVQILQRENIYAGNRQ